MELICLLNYSRRIILASHYYFFVFFHKLYVFEGRQRGYLAGRKDVFPPWVLIFYNSVSITLDKFQAICDYKFCRVPIAINSTCVKRTQTSTKRHMLYLQPVIQNAHECICCLLIFFTAICIILLKRLQGPVALLNCL